MASTTVTHISDDIDGSANAEPVTFSFRGTDYEIDLSKKNTAAFEKALKPYLEAARKSRPASRSRASSSSKQGKRDLNVVREWARAQGIEVSDRGRVAAAVIEQYDAAH